MLLSGIKPKRSREIRKPFPGLRPVASRGIMKMKTRKTVTVDVKIDVAAIARAIVLLILMLH
jgi:hypothetical protein